MTGSNSQIKKILFVSPTGGKAGIDVCLASLVLGLNRDLFQPIVALPLDSFYAKVFREANIIVYELPLKWWFPIEVTTQQLLARLPGIGETVRPLVEIIKKENCDLVFSNTTVSLDGTIAAALARVPHIVHMHALFVDNIYTTLTNEAKNYIYHIFSKSSNKIVCCSSALHSRVSQLMDNSVYVSNGVDIDAFPMKYRDYSNGTIELLTVGHYNANKQQEFVLKALLHVKQNDAFAFNRLHYTCVGPFEQNYLKFLSDFVHQHDLSDNVSFDVFTDQVKGYYEKADVYINSSITESLPLSVMEAMATGLPVVATINEGTKLLVRPQKNGWLCATPEEMADVFVQILMNPESLRSASIESRKMIEQEFSQTNYINKFEQVFTQVLTDGCLPCSVDEIALAYKALTSRPCVLPANLKELRILVIYPSQASATYSICAQEPLEWLKKRHTIQYKAVELSEVQDAALRWAHVVFCIRYYHDAAHTILHKAQRMRKPFVWYIDDNYSQNAKHNLKLVVPLAPNAEYERMFQESDLVFVNNSELKMLGDSLNSNVHLLPCYQLVLDWHPVTNKHTERVTFGFMGTLGRDDDFSFVVPALKSILEEYGDHICLEFIGYCPDELKGYDQVRHFDFMHNYRAFLTFLAEREWDFAIAPLQDTLFNRSKTNNKYREYSGQHIPGIYSNISTYNLAIIDGRNGILSENTSEAWYHAMKKLIEDTELRLKIAQNAFQDIVDHYNIENYANPLLLEMLEAYEKKAQESRLETVFANSSPTKENGTNDLVPLQLTNWETFRLFWKKYGVLTLFIAAWKVVKKSTLWVIRKFKRK